MARVQSAPWAKKEKLVGYRLAPWPQRLPQLYIDRGFTFRLLIMPKVSSTQRVAEGTLEESWGRNLLGLHSSTCASTSSSSRTRTAPPRLATSSQCGKPHSTDALAHVLDAASADVPKDTSLPDYGDQHG
eukprot:1828198-Amphidinium_carterae.1